MKEEKFPNSRKPLRGEGSCGGGGAPRDSAGSGATEDGLTTRAALFAAFLRGRGGRALASHRGLRSVFVCVGDSHRL